MQQRKIAPVVAKYGSFQEADEADDRYWANKSEVERLETLMDLRRMLFDRNQPCSTAKVVYKRSLYEEA